MNNKKTDLSKCKIPFSLDLTYQDVPLISNSAPNFIPNIVVGALEIIPCFTGIVHEGKEIIVKANQLVVLPLDVGYFHVVSGRANIF